MKNMIMAFVGVFFASSAWAHDGVALEKDACVVKAGPYAIHFSAYQRYGEEQEACDDIFKTGATVFGLTPVNSEARDLPLGLKLLDEKGTDLFSIDPKINPNGYVSAYAHNSELEVKRGDKVKRGQTIAKSGQSGAVGSPQLHFELRHGSMPVDPMSCFPSDG